MHNLPVRLHAGSHCVIDYCSLLWGTEVEEGDQNLCYETCNRRQQKLTPHPSLLQVGPAAEKGLRKYLGMNLSQIIFNPAPKHFTSEKSLQSILKSLISLLSD